MIILQNHLWRVTLAWKDSLHEALLMVRVGLGESRVSQ